MNSTKLQVVNHSKIPKPAPSDALSDNPPHNKEEQDYETILPIAELLRQERKYKNLSQKDVYDKTGITNVQVSRIERGECNPTIKTLVKIAPLLGYPIEALLLSSHYQGTIASQKPTYVDYEGNALDLEKIAQSMYRIDGELLLLVKSFYEHYSIEDGELLKILIRNIIKCHIADCTAEVNYDEENSSMNNAFIESFNNLKKFIFSFNKMVRFINK